MALTNKFLQNLISLFAIVLISIILVTVIGYYDEGHAKIYGSMGNYLSAGGYPPFSDYLMWTIIFSVFGLLTFNIISAGKDFKSPLVLRILLSLLSIPLVMFAIVSLIVMTQQLF